MIIDFHAHILPGLDHGCSSLEEARWQVQEASKAGVDVIVLTSHFYPHIESVQNYVERRQDAEELLKSLESEYEIKFLLGAEVLVCEGMEKMEGLDALCIEGTKCILLELPFQDQWEQKIINTVNAIIADGYSVVVAHIERYGMKNLQIALDNEWNVQINSSYRKRMKKRLIIRKCRMAGNIVALGSDIHGRVKAYRDYRGVLRCLGAYSEHIMEKSRELLSM